MQAQARSSVTGPSMHIMKDPVEEAVHVEAQVLTSAAEEHAA